MAGYSVIADIGNTLVRILKENLVPDIIQNPDGIGLCSPTEHGDLSLGIYLYDIAENKDISANGIFNGSIDRKRGASKFIDLYYMLTPYSSSDIKFRASEEQRILGKSLQVMMDHCDLYNDLPSEFAEGDFPIKAEMLALDSDDKMKIWNIPDVQYKLSLYYKVYPIEIKSEKYQTITRVTDTQFIVSE